MKYIHVQGREWRAGYTMHESSQIPRIVGPLTNDGWPHTINQPNIYVSGYLYQYLASIATCTLKIKILNFIVIFPV
jgi:hypothetical protein